MAFLVFSALAIFMRISMQNFSRISLQAQGISCKQDALQKEHLQATCLLKHWRDSTEHTQKSWLGNEEMRLLSRAASVTHISELWQCTGPLYCLSLTKPWIGGYCSSHISTACEHNQRWQLWDQERLSSTEWEKGRLWSSTDLWKSVCFTGWYQSSSNSTDKPILLPLRAAQRESSTAVQHFTAATSTWTKSFTTNSSLILQSLLGDQHGHILFCTLAQRMLWFIAWAWFESFGMERGHVFP